MEPGQVALQLTSMSASMPGGLETHGYAGVEVPWSHRAGAAAYSGVARHSDGSIDMRDSSVGVDWVPVSESTFTWRIQPGLSIPTGGLGTGFSFTSLSTSSFDPRLRTDVVAGGTWLVSLKLLAHVPVYQGWDLRRQGALFRADLKGLRRIGDFVPWLGLSSVRRLPSDPVGAAPDLTDLAASIGTVYTPHARWAIVAQCRYPVWVADGTTSPLAVIVGVRHVVGSPPEGHTH
jgi:hypothetical protein